ncbi:hypothetical protein EBS02_02910 [bacterium]|nr:hypothetical protein [bacterium]
MSKKKSNKFKVIDLSNRRDEKTRGLIDTILDDVKDIKLKGVIAIVLPEKGRPLLYMNMNPEEGFIHMYRANSLISNMVTAYEEDDEVEQNDND